MNANESRPEQPNQPPSSRSDASGQSRVTDAQRRAELEAKLSMLEDCGDKWKVRQELRGLYSKCLRQIDELLASDPKQLMAQVLEQRASCLSLIDTFQEAMSRPDLTVPEAMLLAEQAEKNTRLLVETLEMEKTLIQRLAKSVRARQ